MKLSIVATLYQSAPHVDEFYRRATATALELYGEDYEIVLVNDGSTDDSLDLAIKLTSFDSRLVVVDLSRNFGHHKAMMTGLAYTKGERVLLIDIDLEEEPELLTAFSKRIDQTGCDVVYGIQKIRKGGWFERWSGTWFYWLFNLLTGLALPANMATVRLMSRRYVNALLRHEEREVFMAGLWHITGFNQQAYEIKKHNISRSTYTLKKKLALFVNSVTSFSNVPLISIFYIGVSISLFSLAYISYLLVQWFLLTKPMSGWTSVMASIWLLGGMVISFIGVVGIYLSKIFSESKRRPYTIVREIFTSRRNHQEE